MRPNLSGFKRFVEDMNPSIEKKMGGAGAPTDPGKMDYLGGLGDEMGMEWNDIVSSLEGEPWISTHFALGETLYKRSAWKIMPGTLTKNGAAITLVPQAGDRSYKGTEDGTTLNKASSPDKKQYWLDRQGLIDFLTKGWTPAIQAAQGGGAAGAPPGGAPPMM